MKVDLRLSAGIFPEKDRLSKNGRDTDGTSLQGGTATVEYIVSAEEMQRADENTINYFGIPQLVLMERAALTAKELMERRWQGIFGEEYHACQINRNLFVGNLVKLYKEN